MGSRAEDLESTAEPLCEKCMLKFHAAREFFTERVEHPPATQSGGGDDEELSAMAADTFRAGTCLARAYALGQLQLCPVLDIAPDDALLSMADAWSTWHPDKANEFYEHLPRVSQCLQEAAGDWKAALELYLAEGSAQQKASLAERKTRTDKIRKAWRAGKEVDKTRKRASGGDEESDEDSDDLLRCLRKLVTKRSEIRQKDPVFKCLFRQQYCKKDKCEACRVEKEIRTKIFAPLEKVKH